MRRILLSYLLTTTRALSTMSRKKTSVVWLRNELRVHDNALFSEASENCVAVYCLDPRVYNGAASTSLGDVNFAKCGAKRTKFVLECLNDLGPRLRAQGSELLTIVDTPVNALEQVIGALDADTDIEILCAAGVCEEEIKDEKEVEDSMRKRRHPIPLRRVWENTMYHVDDVEKSIRGELPDDVFTKWRTRVEKADIAIRSSTLSEKKTFIKLADSDSLQKLSGGVPSLSELGYKEEVLDTRGDFFAPIGGETHALGRVERYMWKEDRLKNYFETRNGMIGQAYSSKLAPWLAKGCISPRYVASESLRYESERQKNKSTYWLRFELIWRDYFIYYARKYGRKLFWPSGVKGLGDPSKWDSDMKKFKAWAQGSTGIPLVDANMRELVSTGFMSNRGRQNVASFLVHDLGLDWRLGAAFFESHLIDYTPEANWGNWHAAAGLNGGRLNRFNILKQSKDYDANGDYVKLWCPELQAIPAPSCFEPWKLNKGEQHRYNCIIGEQYPAPVKIKSFQYQQKQPAAGAWESGKLGSGSEARKQQKVRNNQRRRKNNAPDRLQ